MKNILSILLCIAALLALTGCSQPAVQETTAVTEEVLTEYKSAVKESAVMTRGEETLTVAYAYKDGNLIKETVTAADGSAWVNFYTYNDEGLIISEIHKDPAGAKDKYRHTVLDGRQVKTVHTDPSGSKNTLVYAYDEQGLCTGYTLTTAAKEVQEVTYTYNALGAIARIDATGFEAYVTEYEYDDFGNVVKQTVTTDGSAVVTEYTYTYQQ